MSRVMFSFLALLLMSLSGPGFAVSSEAPAGSRACAEPMREMVAPLLEEVVNGQAELGVVLLEALQDGADLCGLMALSAEYGFTPSQVLPALLEAGQSKALISGAAGPAGYDENLVAEVLQLNEGLGYSNQGGNLTQGNPGAIVRGSTLDRQGSVSPSSL